MRILKAIKGFLVETDPKEINQPDKKVITPPEVINLPSRDFTFNTDNSLILEFTERFRKILKDENDRNFPGNDYFEFVAMKDAMSSISDQRLRYISAFAGWSVSGNVSKDSLLSTSNKYLSIVDKEISDFESAYKENYDSVVGKNLADINSKQKQVEEMEIRINVLRKEVEDLQLTNQNATEGLVSKRNAFMQVGNSQRNEILNEIENIKSYIT